MSVAVSIILSLLVLGILIAVHELGHFGAGKLLGFDVLEYSIGMGPAIFKKEKNGTLYAIRCLPIGGMCKFRGEDEDALDEKCFNSFPAWKRLIVVVAGPFMNIVLAYVLGIIMFAIFGAYTNVSYEAPVIAGFSSEESVAAAAGVLEGDYVTAINGEKVSSVDEMIEKLQAVEGDTVLVTVLRPNENTQYAVNGTPYANADELSEIVEKNAYKSYVQTISGGDEKTFTINNITNDEGRKVIGVSISSYYAVDIDFGFFGLFGHTFNYLADIMKQMGSFLASLFNGSFKLEQMAGIVGVVDVVNDGVAEVSKLEISFGEQAAIVAEFGFYLAVLLSINLGIVNILPLPALDGGRAVFLIVEMIRRKAVPAKVEGTIHTVGLLLLLLLVAVVTFNDIFRIIG